jgi:anti-sigma regulatory factor (Ser/Thr protein kinase)
MSRTSELVRQCHELRRQAATLRARAREAVSQSRSLTLDLANILSRIVNDTSRACPRRRPVASGAVDSGSGWSFHLRLRTLPWTLPMARKAVAFMAALRAGAAPEDVGAMEVGVGELLANSWRHGYDGQPGPVDVRMNYEDGRLSVAISDEGKIDAPLETLRGAMEGGQGDSHGLFFLKELMDGVEANVNDACGRGLRVAFSKQVSTPVSH